MNTSKKIISVILVFAIALSLCVIPAFALVEPVVTFWDAAYSSFSDGGFGGGSRGGGFGGGGFGGNGVPTDASSLSEEYNTYVQSLPATGITSTGLYYFYPTYSDYKIVSFADYQKSTKSVLKVYPDCTYELTSSYASSFADINVFSYNPLTFAFNDSVGITTVEFTGSSVPTVFQVPISGVYNKMPLQFSGTAGYGGFGNFPFSCSFTFPTGNYDLTVGSAISHMDASYTLPNMTEIIASITTVFTAAIGWVGTVATTIAGQPILLIACVAVPLCGLGVGLFKRLLSARA